MARESPPYVLIVAIIAFILMAFLWAALNMMVDQVTQSAVWMSGSTDAQNSQGWLLDLFTFIPIFLTLGFGFKLWQVSKEGVR